MVFVCTGVCGYAHSMVISVWWSSSKSGGLPLCVGLGLMLEALVHWAKKSHGATIFNLLFQEIHFEVIVGGGGGCVGNYKQSQQTELWYGQIFDQELEGGLNIITFSVFS